MAWTTEGKLASLAAGQWGMLTAAQATAEGVARSTLLRREQYGTLDRVRPGVYRLPGAPPDRLDGIRAVWLATAPQTPAWERLDLPDVIVGGTAAAWVHQIGDLHPSPYLLYTGRRRQTRHEDVRYRIRHLPRTDVVVIDGLPVTARERTIADLLDQPGTDLSLVAGALRDAEHTGSDLDSERLTEHLDAHASRLGYPRGAELYRRLRELSGVDADRYRDLLANTDLDQQITLQVEARIQEILTPLREHTDQQVRDLLTPPRDQVDRALRDALIPTLQVTAPTVSAPRIPVPPNLFPTLPLSPSTTTIQAVDEVLASPRSSGDTPREESGS